MFRDRSRQAAKAADWVAPTWSQLVQEHSGHVYRLAYRLTGDRFDAEDLTQDVFVRAFNSIHALQPGSVAAWLNRITTNLFLDGARRRSRMRTDVAGGSPESVWGSSSSVGDLYAEGMLDGDVAAALKLLSPEQRVAVVLCDIEGLSYDEIALLLDIKIGTVRSRIARARAQLRTSLAHRAPVSGHRRYLGVS